MPKNDNKQKPPKHKAVVTDSKKKKEIIKATEGKISGTVSRGRGALLRDEKQAIKTANRNAGAKSGIKNLKYYVARKAAEEAKAKRESMPKERPAGYSERKK